MVNKRNHLLANMVVEYHKLQNFHWYVKGKEFFTIHEKLEEYYGFINEAIDEVAEKILMLGGKPIGSLKDFSETASIAEAQNEFLSSEVILGEVEKDFSALLDEAAEIKKSADAEENFLISASMDTYIEEFTKSIWMLRQLCK